jgi:hypothetical protein
VTSSKQDRAQWYRVDLHIHTPASADYHQPTISYLDILHRAELRGIDVLAFTDHNTVSGYAAMRREIEQLQFLAERSRATADEQRLLAEYQRLLSKILVLPGFEFTATFGFHVLGIFPPETPVRRLEHVLMSLHVPYEAIEHGLTEVGASSDVLTAYRAIREAGGICIAAHVNAAHGVAMWNLDFGGQTRIAYTQDRHLHALEVTDLGKRGRHVTQTFFDGSKPEYPRRMRCIQGSDAHQLDSQVDKRGRVINFGVGERPTEVRLRERSFDALIELLEGSDYGASRAFVPGAAADDTIMAARDIGPAVQQAFHEIATQAGVLRYNILSDICAFANTDGGTVYLGISADKLRLPQGVDDPSALTTQLARAVELMVVPTPVITVERAETKGRTVLCVRVERGSERPYALEASKIFVRVGAETVLATRDQIVAMVAEMTQPGQALRPPARVEAVRPESAPTSSEPAHVPRSVADSGRVERRDRREPERPARRPAVESRPEREPAPPRPPKGEVPVDALPRIGVEVIAVEPRGGLNTYTLRDLKTGGVVKNVTRMSASKVWRYVIKQQESNPVQIDKVQWNGDYGLWRKYQRLAEVRYDLVLRTRDGLRCFYAVPDTELKGGWAVFVHAQAQSEEAVAEPSALQEGMDATAAATETPAPLSDRPLASGEAVPTDEATVGRRKRRRRGGRRRKSGVVVSIEGAVEAAEVAEQKVVDTADAVADPPTSETKKPRKRTGVAGKKTVQQQDAVEPSTPLAAQDPEPVKASGRRRKSPPPPDVPGAENAASKTEPPAETRSSRGRRKRSSSSTS